MDPTPFYHGLLKEPKILRALRREHGVGVVDPLVRAFLKGEIETLPEEWYDTVGETARDQGKPVFSVDAMGSAAGDFPVTVYQFGPVFWNGAPDFDDDGFYGSLEEAKAATCEEFEPMIDAMETGKDG